MISWHRFYDPDTGRYISADPIGLRGGVNLYVYTGNDPVNKIDPLGLWTYSGKCSYQSAGDIGGGGIMVCEWESECVGGKKSIGTTETYLAGFTFGSPYGTTQFDLNLNDDLSDNSPTIDNLGGFSQVGSIGFATPWGGGSWFDITLGKGKSEYPLGGQEGWDLSVDSFYGKTYVYNVQTVDCPPCK